MKSDKWEFQEQLAAIVGINSPPQHIGRPRISLPIMLFSLVYKVYYGLSSRDAVSELEKSSYMGKVPHFNTMVKYLDDSMLTSILHRIIQEELGLPEEKIVIPDETLFSKIEVARRNERLCLKIGYYIQQILEEKAAYEQQTFGERL